MAMVCQWFGFKTTRTIFSGLTLKPVVIVSGGLASKPAMTVSGGLASKPVMMVFWFVPQKHQLRFGDLGLKITVAVSWFGPQNQAGYGLSVTPQNQQEGVNAGHASRSSDLLHVEASQARVS
jgi:hypothetical protein